MGIASVFAFQMAVGVGACFSVACFVPGAKADRLGDSDSSTDCRALLKVVLERLGPLLRVLFFIFTLQTARKAREMFFALAGRQANLSESQIGNITALSYICDMCGFPVAGRLIDEYGRRWAGGLSLA